MTTATLPALSLPLRKFLAAWTVGAARREHPQFFHVDLRNGRTAAIFTTDRGGFSHALVYRGETCLGSVSTIRSLVRLAQP